MKLDYFDLISPLPLEIYKVGHIKSPKLKEIAEISYFTYAQYVTFLKMKPIDYYDNLNENNTDQIQEMIATTKYDLLLLDQSFRNIICAALNFFLKKLLNGMTNTNHLSLCLLYKWNPESSLNIL